MVADNAAAIVGGRNIGDIYYGVNTIANYRDLDVLAVGPVVRDLSGVFDRYWNSVSTVPIGAIVDRAHGAADLDAIVARLREAIAAADYPYPIDQDLDELAAQSAELHDKLVWGFLCQGGVTPFWSSFAFHSFVRPAPRAFFRPDRIFPSPARAAAVKDGASSAPPKACP
jgi:phosphatidylserine/phosphatidylglycerophosphate/cardiolipin synthase-like enzyme